MSAASDRHVAAANEAFYERFWRESSGYQSPWPNAEEAARGGAVLRFVGCIAERESQPLSMIDVGCGRGWLAHLLSVYGDVSGCDLAEGGLRLARELFPNIPFHHGALGDLIQQQRLPRVRLVVCSEVVEHVPDDGKPAFVAELHSALVPGGHCVITTPRQEMFARAGASSSQLVEAWATERRIATLFSAAGFRRRGFTRAGAAGGGLASRAAHWVERHTGRPVPASVAAWLEWRSALYQVWWFQRVDAPR